eukprot:39796-Eustigmatos_ZCMA.PRE.1
MIITSNMITIIAIAILMNDGRPSILSPLPAKVSVLSVKAHVTASSSQAQLQAMFGLSEAEMRTVIEACCYVLEQ